MPEPRGRVYRLPWADAVQREVGLVEVMRWRVAEWDPSRVSAVDDMTFEEVCRVWMLKMADSDQAWHYGA